MTQVVDRGAGCGQVVHSEVIVGWHGDEKSAIR
jgi:hypothetical protein